MQGKREKRRQVHAVEVCVFVGRKAYKLVGCERDWCPMGGEQAPEGRVVELKSTSLGLVSWGSTKDEAKDMMRSLIRAKITEGEGE